MRPETTRLVPGVFARREWYVGKPPVYPGDGMLWAVQPHVRCVGARPLGKSPADSIGGLEHLVADDGGRRLV
jgi:hypothetical protein